MRRIKVTDKQVAAFKEALARLPQIRILIAAMMLLCAWTAGAADVRTTGYLNGWDVVIVESSRIPTLVCRSPFADKNRLVIHCYGENQPLLGEITGSDGMLEGWTVISGRAFICKNPVVQAPEHMIVCEKPKD